MAVISVPLFFSLLPSVLALGLAIGAAVRIRRAPFVLRGTSMAIASMIVAAATLVGGLAFDAMVASANNNPNHPVSGLPAPVAPGMAASVVR